MQSHKFQGNVRPQLEGSYLGKIIFFLLWTSLLIGFSGTSVLCFEPRIDDAPETASVVSNQGTATYNIPLQVPPGRNKIEPNLSLTYSSNHSNGVLGVGWGLNVSRIQRSTKRGVDYGASDFEFLHNGSKNELVVSDSTSGEYRAKIEGEFTKFQFLGEAQGWLVTSRDGIQYWYGQRTVANSQQTNPYGTFCWYLDFVMDPNGNSMEFSYWQDQGQVYLEKIDYTGNHYLSKSGTNSVQFYYENRPDTMENLITHSEVVTAYRLRTIKMTANGSLAAAYNLTYTQSQSTQRSLLESLQQYGSDTDLDSSGTITEGQGTALPKTNFVWNSNTANSFSSVYDGDGIAGYDMGSDSDHAFPFDFNGDGLQDIFMYRPDRGAVNVVRSEGNGSFSSVYFQGDSGGGIGGFDLGSIQDNALPFDYNGDGYHDLFLYRPGSGAAFVLRSEGDGTFTAVYKQGHGGSGIAGYDLGDGDDPDDQEDSSDKVITFDYNGDGLSDLFLYRQGNGAACVARSEGDGTFTSVYIRGQGGGGIGGFDLGSYKDVVFSFDYNGDGFDDLCLYRPGDQAIYIVRSNGDGTFTTVYSSGHGGPGIGGYDLSSDRDKVFPFDYNGDGLGDICLYRPDGGQIYIVRSNGDGTFTNVYNSGGNGIAGYDLGSEKDRVFPFDYNGDGLSDLFLYRPGRGAVYVARSNGNATYTAVYATGNHGDGIATYDLNGNDWVFPFDYNGNGTSDLFLYRPGSGPTHILKSDSPFSDLLTNITVDYGSSIEITYQPYSQKLPFVLQTLSQVTVDDGNGNVSATDYSYTGGVYDYSSREFRGFESDNKNNPDTTSLETWYHQDEYLKGRPDKSYFYGSDGSLHSETTYTWDQEAISGTESVFVKLSQKKTDHYDNSGSWFSQEDYTYYNDATHGNTGLLETKTNSGTDGENVVTTNTYSNYSDWLWRQTGSTVSGPVYGTARTTTNTYETTTGNMLSKKEGDMMTSFLYDEYGNPEYVTQHFSDSASSTTQTVYETQSHTYPENVINQLGHTVTYDYDHRYGQVQSVTDENSQQTTSTFDPFGRPYTTSYPDGGHQEHLYYDTVSPRYTVTKIKEAEGSTVDTYEYFDGLDRSIRTETIGEQIDGTSKTIVTERYYDTMGRQYRTDGPYFSTDPEGTAYPWQQTAFDERGRPLAIVSPSAAYDTGYSSNTNAQSFIALCGDGISTDGCVFTTSTYEGLSTTTVDPDGFSRTEKKDYLGRVSEVVEHTGSGDQTTLYSHNAAGDLRVVTNALNIVKSMEYDLAGNMTSMDDPDLGFIRSTYDWAGNLTTQTDNIGQVITFNYDELGRLKQKIFSNANSNNVEYWYDHPVISNCIGRQWKVSNNLVTVLYNEYDAMGRVLSESTTISGDSAMNHMFYEYDLSGKTTKIVYPDTFELIYEYYPSSGLIKTVKSGSGFTYATLSDYQPSGKIGRIDLGSQTYTINTYDDWSTRLLSIQSVSPLEGTVQNREYTYSPAGDMVRISDLHNQETYDYMYDYLHRLVAETSSAVGEDLILSAMASNVYDSSLPLHGVKSTVFNGETYSYSYDGNGNMEQGPDFTDTSLETVPYRQISYDGDNMPVEIVHELHGTTTFLYDPEKKRAKKSSPAGDTYYYSQYYEVNNGIATKYLFAGNTRVAMIENDAGTLSTHYFHKDHLGSSTVMTDESGTTKESTEYLPYGAKRSQIGDEVTDYKFTDQEEDKETGLYNYDARLYDPNIGLFASPDSIVPDWYNPQSLNRFAYVLNSPLNYVDPSGHFSLNCMWQSFQSGWDTGTNFFDSFKGGLNASADYASFELSNLNTYSSWFTDALDQGHEPISPEAPWGSVMWDTYSYSDQMSMIQEYSVDLSSGPQYGVIDPYGLGGRLATNNSKSLVQQADDLIPLNQNRNRVTLRSEKAQMDVDLSGAPHAGVETPHTKISPRNYQAPENLQPAYNTSTKKANYRPATQEDIRTVRRYLEHQKR